MPAPPPRETRRARTRARILAAAERHFAERGFSDARLEDIAADVGIRRAAIFYHFRDKREVYRAVLDAVFGELLARSRAALAGDEPPAGRLLAGVAAWVDFVAERPAVARLLLREAASASPGTRSELAQASAPILSAFHRLLEQGRRDGSLAPLHADPFQFASAVAGMTLFGAVAMPALAAGAPAEPPGPAALARHKRDVLRVAGRLLGAEDRGAAALPARAAAAASAPSLRRKSRGGGWTSS
jgi:TetR/AcrR family transcriptional regulator